MKTPRLVLASMAVLVALLGLVFGIGLLVLQKTKLPMEMMLIISAIFALSVVLLQYLLGPKLIDWIVETRWTTPAELGQDFDLWMKKTCRTFKIPVPQFGIIEDQAPNAFTYGNGPWNARVVVTRGVIDMLDAEELKAVIAHELGHIKNRDFIFMTLVQALVLVLYTLYIMARAGARKDSFWIVPVSFIAYQLSYYVSLLISRIREYMADYASAQIMQSGNSLSSALVKISYGLADSNGQSRQAVYSQAPAPGRNTTAPAPAVASATPNGGLYASQGSLYDYDAPKIDINKVTQSDRVTPALLSNLQDIKKQGEKRELGFEPQAVAKKEGFSVKTLGAFGIAGTGSMRSAVTWFDPHGGIDTKNFVHAARWELYNPWARIAELISTHPLTALRIKALQKLNRLWNVPDQFDLSKVKPAKYPRFFGDLLVISLPLASMALALGAVTGLGLTQAPLQVAGIGLAAFSIGQILKLLATYPGSYHRAKVVHLLGEVNVSHVNPQPVVIEGVFTGRMDPGVPWANDFILQDDTGFIACVYRQPLGFIEALWGWGFAQGWVGKHVSVTGWYRRFGAPYVEIESFQLFGSTDRHRCHFRTFAYLMAFLGAVGGGALVMLG